jgi:hypothetical protein
MSKTVTINTLKNQKTRSENRHHTRTYLNV